MSSPLLRMQDVTKRFGATAALRGVTLEVRAGQVMALIGENGAGKSTLMKVLSGAIPADSGQLWISGSPYRPRGPQDALKAGVGMIYQELNLAPDLSVEDNILLGQELHRWGWLRREAGRQKVREVLDLLGHPELRPELPVRALSVGAQQLVEIARALVLQARLLVFDEPTSSLGRHDVEHLFQTIHRLKQRGLGIIYISHFLEEIRQIGDAYTVLRDGQVVGHGPLEEATQQQIVSMMVGRTVEELFPRVPHTIGEELLSLDGLSGQRIPENVRLVVRRGEILGLAGLVGAGRTELLRAIYGLDPVRRGTVRIAGATVGAGPQGGIRSGLGMVSEDRKSEGLAQSRSIADNLTYSRLRPYARWGLLDLARRERAVCEWMRRLEVKAAGPEHPVETLSGGNQQKVAIARVLHQNADVLLLDEPTRGIDVGTKVQIYRLIGELAAEGKAILFVSSYLPELLAICDRVAVMARGRLRQVLDAQACTDEQVMALATSIEEPVEESHS